MEFPSSAAPSIDRLALLFPQLEIHELIRISEVSTVFQAVQTSLDRKVALKILPEHLADSQASVSAFSTAARMMAPLMHPNLIRVFDFGETDGLLWVIQDWHGGRTIREMLAEGPFELKLIGQLMSEICRGLEHAHEHGAIHGDLRASSVIVNESGKARVMDFGLGRLARGVQDEGTLVVAPELLDEGVPVDHRVDIFALGLLFYEMLVGKRPVGEIECPSVLRPGLGEEFDTVVGKCLAAVAGDRYSNCSELRLEIDRLMAIPEPSLAQPSRPKPALISGTTSTPRALPRPQPSYADYQPEPDSAGKKWLWIPGLAIVVVIAWAIYSAKSKEFDQLEREQVTKIREIEEKIRENERMLDEESSESGADAKRTGTESTAAETADDRGSEMVPGLEPTETGIAGESEPAGVADGDTSEANAQLDRQADASSPEPVAAGVAEVAGVPELEQLREKLRVNAGELAKAAATELEALQRSHSEACEEELKTATGGEIAFWQTELEICGRLVQLPQDPPPGSPKQATALREQWKSRFAAAIAPLARFRKIYEVETEKIRDRCISNGDFRPVEALELEIEAALQPRYFLMLCGVES